MGLNKSKGNMYGFITDTWNPIRGKCLHDCPYCYMKDPPLSFNWDLPAHLVETELDLDLGKGKAIFVGSSTDMWGDWISNKDIWKVLEHCGKYDNQYLFQTKNPCRYKEHHGHLPKNTILGCTIETNRKIPSNYELLDSPLQRHYDMVYLSSRGLKVAVTIEPIMKFDLPMMVDFIEDIQPEWVAIGADSGDNKLNEPDADEVKELIKGLDKITRVIKKPNISRIIGKE